MGEVRQASRKRERVALVIFIILVLLGGGLLSAYFLTGKTWTVAATIVDDAAGSMDDYSVVVFAGVAKPEAKAAPSSSSPASSAQSTSSSSAAASSQDGSNESSSSSSDATRMDDGRPVTSMRDALGSSDGFNSRDELMEKILSTYQRADKHQSLLQDGRIYASDVRDLYELKGAGAITLNIANPGIYSTPVTLNAGGRKFGVFSVSAYTSRAKLKTIVTKLRKEGAQSIICIAPRTNLIATCDGIDAVVLTEPTEKDASGDDIGNTLVADTPYIGEVGVIAFSSNNVPSYKVIDEI